jgi:hypothetical protein
VAVFCADADAFEAVFEADLDTLEADFDADFDAFEAASEADFDALEADFDAFDTDSTADFDAFEIEADARSTDSIEDMIDLLLFLSETATTPPAKAWISLIVSEREHISLTHPAECSTTHYSRSPKQHTVDYDILSVPDGIRCHTKCSRYSTSCDSVGSYITSDPASDLSSNGDNRPCFAKPG